MINQNKKFERLEKLQNKIANKLNSIENKYINEDSNYKFNLNNDQYKLQSDLDEILKDKSEKDIDINFLKFYQHLSSKSGSKIKEYKQCNQHNNNLQYSSSIKQNNITSLHYPENIIIKKETYEKEVETDKQTFVRFEPVDKLDRDIINSVTDTLTNNTKYLVHKKQNNFLTNELVHLRIKLNKINNKNKLLKNLVKNDESIKNCMFLQKIMTTFIEKLAVNWNEIVNLIVDDLLEEEIYNLNEIELHRFEKIDIDNLIAMDNENDNKVIERNIMSGKESIIEINRILKEYKTNEEFLSNKYN